MGFTFIATGDTIMSGYYTRDYDGYKELTSLIASADVAMNNMETPLADKWGTVSSFSGGSWLRSPTSLLDDLKDFGFNCYAFANNHALDQFYGGLYSTLEAFRSRSIPVAGAGRDLAEATRHCKVETPKGSLALLAVTSSFQPSCAAGNPRGEIPGRPGVSMLRHDVKFSVTEEQFKALQEIAEAAKVNGRLKNRAKLGSVLIGDGVFPFGPLQFVVGEPARMTEPNPWDMERLETAIKAAVQDADHTVVYFHNHETKGDSDAEPDFFAETFSRAAIDWGAEAVICSGTHQVKAVEIYNGKPIFYSIANFFFRGQDLDLYPEEWYEKYNLDKSLTAEEARNVRSKNGTMGLYSRPYCFRSIAPMLEWAEDGSLKIAAIPLSLGFHDGPESRGFPRIASQEDADTLLAQLQKLCKPYGTEVTTDAQGLFVFRKSLT